MFRRLPMINHRIRAAELGQTKAVLKGNLFAISQSRFPLSLLLQDCRKSLSYRAGEEQQTVIRTAIIQDRLVDIKTWKSILRRKAFQLTTLLR